LAWENFREAPGRKNTFTDWRTWAGEEVGSRERGSTGRHSGGDLEDGDEHVDGALEIMPP
jgi:hypothetical protein